MNTLCTRRAALQAIVTGTLAPAALPVFDANLVDAIPEAPRMARPELAAVLASLELNSIKSNHPEWWHKMRYTGLIQLCEGELCFYGIGPAALNRLRKEDFRRFLTEADSELLGEAEAGDGRSWVLIVTGTVSRELLTEVPPPEWQRKPPRWAHEPSCSQAESA